MTPCHLAPGLESDLGLTAKPDSIRIEPLNAQGYSTNWV